MTHNVPLGSEQRPIIVKSEILRTEKVAEICEHYDWKYIIRLELTEDLTDLKKAMKERMKPASPYDPSLLIVEKNIDFAVQKSTLNLISRIFECFSRFRGTSCA